MCNIALFFRGNPETPGEGLLRRGPHGSGRGGWETHFPLSPFWILCLCMHYLLSGSTRQVSRWVVSSLHEQPRCTGVLSCPSPASLTCVHVPVLAGNGVRPLVLLRVSCFSVQLQGIPFRAQQKCRIWAQTQTCIPPLLVNKTPGGQV